MQAWGFVSLAAAAGSLTHDGIWRHVGPRSVPLRRPGLPRPVCCHCIGQPACRHCRPRNHRRRPGGECGNGAPQPRVRCQFAGGGGGAEGGAAEVRAHGVEGVLGHQLHSKVGGRKGGSRLPLLAATTTACRAGRQQRDTSLRPPRRRRLPTWVGLQVGLAAVHASPTPSGLSAPPFHTTLPRITRFLSEARDPRGSSTWRCCHCKRSGSGGSGCGGEVAAVARWGGGCASHGCRGRAPCAACSAAGPGALPCPLPAIALFTPHLLPARPAAGAGAVGRLLRQVPPGL